MNQLPIADRREVRRAAVQAMAASGPISAVAAPVPGEGSPMLGAVVVYFRRKLALAPDETEALSVLAGQAGMAIENAMLGVCHSCANPLTAA